MYVFITIVVTSMCICMYLHLAQRHNIYGTYARYISFKNFNWKLLCTLLMIFISRAQAHNKFVFLLSTCTIYSGKSFYSCVNIVMPKCNIFELESLLQLNLLDVYIGYFISRFIFI